MYVSYEFYTATYGGKLTEEAFNALEGRAEYYIRYLTEKDAFSTELEAVKMAVCKAADVIYSNTTEDGEAKRAVNSESIDGYSVTYGSTTDETADDTLRRLILRGVYVYLLPTGLLYRGIG